MSKIKFKVLMNGEEIWSGYAIDEDDAIEQAGIEVV